MTALRKTPLTDAAFAKHPNSPALCIDELLKCSSSLEREVAEMREELRKAVVVVDAQKGLLDETICLIRRLKGHLVTHMKSFPLLEQDVDALLARLDGSKK